MGVEFCPMCTRRMSGCHCGDWKVNAKGTVNKDWETKVRKFQGYPAIVAHKPKQRRKLNGKVTVRRASATMR